MSTIWKDGQFIDGFAPTMFHDDSGFGGALGVFDSMLARDGVLIDPGEHFERLLHDVNVVLGMGESWLPGFVSMTNVWLPLLSQNNLTKGYARVRTTVTGGVSNGPLAISTVPTVFVTAQRSGSPEEVQPVKCTVIRDFPRVVGDVLENCKRLDYTRSFAARRMARALGAEEAIITNTEGNIACGATSNIFIKENGQMFTPPLRDGVLAGVTRRMILQRGGAIEQSISEERMRKADEVYLTNSFVGMRKVIL